AKGHDVFWPDVQVCGNHLQGMTLGDGRMEKLQQVERGLRDIELALEEPFKLRSLVAYLALLPDAHNFDAGQRIEARDILDLNGWRHGRTVPTACARRVLIDVDAMQGMIGTIEAESVQGI